MYALEISHSFAGGIAKITFLIKRACFVHNIIVTAVLFVSFMRTKRNFGNHCFLVLPHICEMMRGSALSIP